MSRDWSLMSGTTQLEIAIAKTKAEFVTFLHNCTEHEKGFGRVVQYLSNCSANKLPVKRKELLDCLKTVMSDCGDQMRVEYGVESGVNSRRDQYYNDNRLSAQYTLATDRVHNTLWLRLLKYIMHYRTTVL